MKQSVLNNSIKRIEFTSLSSPNEISSAYLNKQPVNANKKIKINKPKQNINETKRYIHKQRRAVQCSQINSSTLTDNKLSEILRREDNLDYNFKCYEISKSDSKALNKINNSVSTMSINNILSLNNAHSSVIQSISLSDFELESCYLSRYNQNNPEKTLDNIYNYAMINPDTFIPLENDKYSFLYNSFNERFVYDFSDNFNDDY